ncbi:MAG: amidohydrolase family protein [Pseudomonadota bacterium]
MPERGMGITGVDSHAHVFERALPSIAQPRHRPAYDAPPDDYLAHLDRHGVSHGVLVQPSFLGTDNHYLLDAIRRQPQRLRGVAVVAPDASADTLAALAAGGIVGLRLNLVGLDIPDFTAPAWQALLGRARDLGWFVEIHREAHDVPALLNALRPSGCALVVDHFGRPDPMRGGEDPGFAALLRAAGGGRVWVKLSGAYRNARAPRLPLARRPLDLSMRDAAAARMAATALLHAFGPERLLWGSDWPHTQHEDMTDFARSRLVLDDWVPDAVQRRRILVDTPAALFKIA